MREVDIGGVEEVAELVIGVDFEGDAAEAVAAANNNAFFGRLLCHGSRKVAKKMHQCQKNPKKMCTFAALSFRA